MSWILQLTVGIPPLSWPAFYFILQYLYLDWINIGSHSSKSIIFLPKVSEWLFWSTGKQVREKEKEKEKRKGSKQKKKRKHARAGRNVYAEMRLEHFFLFAMLLFFDELSKVFTFVKVTIVEWCSFVKLIYERR